ncbi:MAG: aldo/keto reductase [Sedimentisphaerales bacterium]|nr:aldo/keto reductase [Sedimentisphaerales bacterium]
MQGKPLTRRQFIERAAAIAGSVVLSPLAAAAGRKLTAVDQVTLGRTGIKLSRLGIGCGTNSGRVQADLGQDGFNRLIRYAYDQGITYIDIARGYRTHGMLREAIKGLPREKLFIQTKMGGVPNKAFENIEQYCMDYGVDYIDCLLVHCTVTPDWDERRKLVLDAMEKAKDKKIIRAHGVSCHSLPALKRSVDVDFVDVHLVRINPQGAYMDTPRTDTWNAPSSADHVLPVMEQVARMRDKGRGVIGMKLVGNGDFTDPADRERAMQFVMQSGLTDAVTVGFKSPAEIDETIRRMNEALAGIS